MGAGLCLRLIVLIGCVAWVRSTESADSAPQYESGDIRIPAARANEPLRQFSVDAAMEYLEQGAIAWSQERKCVACHTTGTYLQMRPSLTPVLGKPPETMRDFFIQQLEKSSDEGIEKLRQGIRPTQVAYIAHGLAEWDAHIRGTLSTATKDALTLMLKLQSDDGSWGNTECWPPFESSSYQGATVAALALATAPGFLEMANQSQAAAITKLRQLLQTQEPPHDYARLLLLWTATRLPDLMNERQRRETIDLVWRHQRKDGGWSIRTFSSPEKWGNGNRAEKLRSEREFIDPPSDGHQTGLVVLVLREAGVSARDNRIQRAVDWIKTNQRQSGRWWTRSLNTDRYHFITYSGTFYPLLALHKCDAL